MSTNALQFKTTVATTETDKSVIINLSSASKTIALTLTISISKKEYMLSDKSSGGGCISSSTAFLTWPTSDTKTWTLYTTDMSFVLECNGQIVMAYAIVDSSSCETILETGLTSATVATADSATVSARGVCKFVLKSQISIS